ncbi:hypothetical protein ATK86_6406 [Nocardia fluminea]|uniref:Uncharacterized protein n=1 Tax=Nocardia fluminea TaxID=134984 RepID=A0A2N3VJY1_9NOCA|nr:hypothetical protein ATK86_6406 [Nocardia fluminea]
MCKANPEPARRLQGSRPSLRAVAHLDPHIDVVEAEWNRSAIHNWVCHAVWPTRTSPTSGRNSLRRRQIGVSPSGRSPRARTARQQYRGWLERPGPPGPPQRLRACWSVIDRLPSRRDMTWNGSEVPTRSTVIGAQQEWGSRYARDRARRRGGRDQRGRASSTQSGAAVGTVRSSVKPPRASSSRNCASVRSWPPSVLTSISRSMNLPACGR